MLAASGFDVVDVGETRRLLMTPGVESTWSIGRNEADEIDGLVYVNKNTDILKIKYPINSTSRLKR